jgi:DNA-directed RNA polymerase subunit K/omega
MQHDTQIFTYNNLKKNYNPKENISPPFLTIYEKTSILGLRMQQLMLGAPSTISDTDIRQFNNVEDIVLEELKQKKLPYIICRRLPGNTKEYWHLNDLHIY